MRILGIETSCDETAASVVKDGYCLLSNVVASSIDLHAAYGGVVPEIAARSHIESINPVIEKALAEAFPQKPEAQNSDFRLQTSDFDPWDQIDGIAVTYGAGLGGSLLVGVLTARTLAIIHNKPLYGINHVEAHAYANFLTEASPSLSSTYHLPSSAPRFPMLGLIVSGGHSQLVLWRDHFDYTLLGQTHDDAIGEAFDKVAKILGLPYPGGPSISQKAHAGDPNAYKLPKAKLTSVSQELVGLRKDMQTSSLFGLSEVQGNNEKRASRTGGTMSEARKQLTPQFAKRNDRVGGFADDSISATNGRGYDFSFSGLKTAVLRLAQKECGKTHEFPSQKLSELLSEAQKANIAASFQRVAVETVVDKTVQAFEEFQPKSVIIGGGVASSSELRRQLSDRLPLPVSYPDPKLCTDNGAMIATLGCFKAMSGQPTADPYSLEIAPNLSM